MRLARILRFLSLIASILGFLSLFGVLKSCIDLALLAIRRLILTRTVPARVAPHDVFRPSG